MGLFGRKKTGYQRTGSFAYMATGVDEKTLGEPAFSDLVMCAKMLEKTTGGNVNYMLNSIPGSDMEGATFDNWEVKQVFRGFGVDVPNPRQAGSVPTTLAEIDKKGHALMRQAASEEDQKNVLVELQMATVSCVVSLLKEHPHLKAPFYTYCKNTWRK